MFFLIYQDRELEVQSDEEDDFFTSSIVSDSEEYFFAPNYESDEQLHLTLVSKVGVICLKAYFDTDYISQILPDGSEELIPYFFGRDVFSILGCVLLNYSDNDENNNHNHQFIVKIAIDGCMGFLNVSAQILKVTDKKQGPPAIVAMEILKESQHNIHKLFEATRLLEDLHELAAFYNIRVCFCGDSKVYHIFSGDLLYSKGCQRRRFTFHYKKLYILI